MDLVPKSILRALDTLEGSLTEFESAVSDMAKDDTIESDPTRKAQRDLALALAINGLVVMLKRAKGEDIEEALLQFEKCKKAAEKFKEKTGTSAQTEGATKKRESSAVSTSASKTPNAKGSGAGQSSKKRKIDTSLVRIMDWMYAYFS